MKKRISMMLLTGVLLMMSAAPAVTYAAAKSTKTVQAEKTEYTFTLDKAEIKMNGDASAVVAALGKADKYFEAQSCAFQGLDKTYTYKGFELSTYPVKEKDYVNSVYFLDDSVSTEEGIKIGSSYQDMATAYGKSYKEDHGVYRYALGKSELAFFMDGKNKINGIEYLAITK